MKQFTLTTTVGMMKNGNKAIVNVDDQKDWERRGWKKVSGPHAPRKTGEEGQVQEEIEHIEVQDEATSDADPGDEQEEEGESDEASGEDEGESEDTEETSETAEESPAPKKKAKRKGRRG